MSHFTVLVIGDNVEKQLEPFWELDLSVAEMAEDPRSEFHLEVAKDDIPSKAREAAENHIKWLHSRNVSFGKLKASGKYNKAVESMLHHGFGYEEKDYEGLINRAMESNREDMRKYRKYLQDEDWSTILSDYQGGGQNIDGDWGYWHNPNAKWDWYQVGGRWRGYFKLKDGAVGKMGESSWQNAGHEMPNGKADIALACAIDWKGMKTENQIHAEKNWQSHLEKQEKEEKGYWPYAEYGIETDDTEESYKKRMNSVATFAVVKDGIWYERGKMGWFACVSNEKAQDQWDEEFDKLVMGLPDDILLTLVDCHI